MSLIKKLNNRFLIYVVFALTFVRMAVSQLLPARAMAASMPKQRIPAGLKKSLLLRVAKRTGAAAPERHYALEVTGVFPFVRIVSFAHQAVPVPLENAAFSSAGVAPEFDLQVLTAGAHPTTSGAVTRAGQSNLLGFCSSCSSCFSCSSCSNCSSCSSCSCGCAGCSSCSSCSSCTSCSSCFFCSCFFCTSCFY